MVYSCNENTYVCCFTVFLWNIQEDGTNNNNCKDNTTQELAFKFTFQALAADRSSTVKVPKLRFRLSFTSANLSATSMILKFSVLSLWLFSMAVVLNLFWPTFDLNHVFTLLANESDLSPLALVSGFTWKSLHKVMISLIAQTKRKTESLSSS